MSLLLRQLLLASVIACAAAPAAHADPKPTTAPSSAPATAGCTMHVKSAKLDVVSLRPPHTAPAAGPSDDGALFSGLREGQTPKEEERHTDQKLLIIQIEVTNAGREKCDYHSLAGSDAKCPGMAVLHDDARHVYALANFGDLEVVGAVKGAKTLKPGESITDVLVFEVPPKNAKGLLLLIPKDNVDRKDHVEPLPITPER